MIKLVYLFFLIAFPFLSSKSQESTKDNYNLVGQIHQPAYVCYRIPEKIIIDGNLSEWKTVPQTSDFMHITGITENAPEYKTICKMAYDDLGLYIASYMEEPHIWSYYTQHDSKVCQENCFEVFINLTNDTHNYMEYEINALGTDWDLFLTRPYRDNPVILSDWEFLGMESSVCVEGTVNHPNDVDKSWSVEIFIPWSSINQSVRGRKGKPRPGEQIRMNMARVEWETSVVDGKYVKESTETCVEPIKYWVWAPAGEVNMHCPELWGYVQFSDKVAGEGIDDYVEYVGESTKKILRQLYFREKDFFKKSGSYTENLEILGASEICTAEQVSSLVVETTSSLFEITLPSKDGKVWKIDDKGLIWNI